MIIGKSELSVDTLIALIGCVILEWIFFIDAFIHEWSIVHYTMIPSVGFIGIYILSTRVKEVKKEQSSQEDVQ